MARKTMWAVVGALLAFAPTASAVEYELDIDGALMYAKEMRAFGVDYDDDGPKVEVTAALTALEAGIVGIGDFMEIKFDIGGATFRENVRDSDLNPNPEDATGAPLTTLAGCTLRVKDTVGGDSGTSSVTFQVEASQANCVGAAGNAVFTFEMPPLNGAGRCTGAPTDLCPVTVRVTTSTPGGNSWPDTSDDGVTVAMACPTSEPARNCTQLIGGQLRKLGATGRDVPLISFVYGLTQSVVTPPVALGGMDSDGDNRLDRGRTKIDFGDGGASDRRKFVGPAGRPDQAYLAAVSVGVTRASACTTDDPIPAGCVRQSDGKEFRISRNGEGRGEMFIAVFGDFREDDMVFLDINGNGNPDRGESLSLEDDGAMASAFDLLALSGNARAAAGDAGAIDREEGVKSATNLVYRANGEDSLRPSEFRISSNVVFEVQESVADPEDRFDFDAWRAGDPSISTRHNTSYTVIESTQHSYSIPDLDGEFADRGNLRIKCEVTTACTVYLECDGGAGGYWFGELDNEIDGRATMRLSANDIAGVLNVGDDGGWMNGLQCAVHSDRMITVQSLTRAGGVLVNHTYIARD